MSGGNDNYANVSLLGYDPSGELPPPPTGGEDSEQTTAELLDYCQRLHGALSSLLELFNTRSRVGFQSVNDGSNTYDASKDGILTFTAGSGQTISVDPDTGEMTFTSTGSGNATFSSDGSSPPSGQDTGDTWYVTADGGGYVEGRTYRWDGSSWVEVGNPIYNTTITAGQINITEIVDAGAAAQADNLDGIADGTSYAKVNKTAISGGKIVLTSDGVTGTLATGFTEAKCTDATANNTTTALQSTVTITSGGITMSAGGKIMGGKSDYPNASTAGFYLGYVGTGDDSQVYNNYVFRVGDTSEYVDWNGSNINIYCTGGKIGSSSNYFDISGNKLYISDASAPTTNYVEIYNGQITAHQSGQYTVTIGGTSGISTGEFMAGAVIAGYGGCRMDRSGNDMYWVLKSVDDVYRIKHDDGASSYILDSWTIQNCSIAASQITSGTMSGSRISGGTFGAVNASALTSLNASSLASGTVPQARQSATIRSDTYSGDGSTSQTINHSLGVTPSFIMVAYMDSNYQATTGTPTATNISNVTATSFDVSGTSLGTGNLNVNASRYLYIVAI